jgi:periplasmic protein CpxP/Spy
MTKTRFLYLVIAVLLLCNAGTWLVLAKGPGPLFHGEGPKKLIADKLRFSQTQKIQYDALIEQHRAAIRAKETELQGAKTELYALLNENNAPQKDSVVARIGQIHEAIEQVHFAHFQAIKALCTPEQDPLFKALTGELEVFFRKKR